jgi:hypothetical protein
VYEGEKTMNEVTNSIFQSGQKVPVEGWYEVVGGVSNGASRESRRSLVQLTTNQLFPNYDGRAICWHLLDRNPLFTQKTIPSLTS